MWIRLCLKYEIYILPDKLVRFRVHNNEANVSGNQPEKRIRSMYEFYKTLENYKKIENFDDLVKVFPYAEKFNRKEDTDLHFALAMVALEENPTILTQLFGLDILFELLADPVRSANIKYLYNFDHMDFIDLTGKHDIFSREQIPYLHRILVEKDEQLKVLNQTIAEIAPFTGMLTKRVAKIIRLAHKAIGYVMRRDFDGLIKRIRMRKQDTL
jgi:hypothetical protein